MAGIITITINVSNDDYFVDKSDLDTKFEESITDAIVTFDGEIDEDDVLVEFTQKSSASSSLADNDLN